MAQGGVEGCIVEQLFKAFICRQNLHRDDGGHQQSTPTTVDNNASLTCAGDTRYFQLGNQLLSGCAKLNKFVILHFIFYSYQCNVTHKT